MWFSTSEQFAVALYSLFMGIFLGVVYDFIKVSRVMLGISSYSTVFKNTEGFTLPLISKTISPSFGNNNNSVYKFILLLFGDITFSLIAAASYSVFLFHAIRGQIRWYFILASAIGFFAYYFTISKFFIMLIEALTFCIRVILAYVFTIIAFPIRMFFLLIKFSLKIFSEKIVIPLWVMVKYKRYVRYTQKRCKLLDKDIMFQAD